MTDLSKDPIFTLSGKVLIYKGRGTSLGFPTANIEVEMDVSDGIYVGYVRVFDVFYEALIFVGAPITFNETQRFAEAYLLDFSGNLYGLDVCMLLLTKIRNVQKFKSAEALVMQMREDEKIAREYFTLK